MRINNTVNHKEINMLEGRLISNLFAYIMPIVFSNLLQLLYSAADMLIVGLSGVDGAIGAIGTTTAMLNLLLDLFIGLAVGTTIVVGKNIGSADREGTQKAVHTSLIIGGMVGLFCGILGIAVCKFILRLMGNRGHILELSVLYARLIFAGTPFLALTNFLISVFRGKGDTKTPLFVLSFTGALNVFLNLVFVLFLRMSVDGVAVATVLSNLTAMLLLSIRLSNDVGWCRISWKKLRYDCRSGEEIIRNGLPASIQSVIFSLSNVLIQSSITGLNNLACPGGSDILDGNATGTNIEGFTIGAMNAVGSAAVAFTSQHVGAKKYKRITLVMSGCFLVAMVVGAVFAIPTILFRHKLIGMYISTPLAIETAELRLFIMLGGYLLYAGADIGASVLRGLGKSTTSMVITIVGSCVFRVIWLATVFRLAPTIELIYILYPLTWGISAVVHLFVVIRTRRKLIQWQYGT